MPDRFSALVNNEFEFDLLETDIHSLDVVKKGADHYHLIYKNRSVSVRMLTADLNSGHYRVEVNGEIYTVALRTPLDLFIQQMGFGRSEDLLIDKVLAPMPGLLLDIYVKEGQEVEKDEPLLVLEAMKMENVILSPGKGVIDKIMHAKGETVEKGIELISFSIV